MQVQVTQYLLPDGRKRQTSVDVPDSLAPILKRIEKAGLVIEAEILTTSEVSFTLACHKYAADYDILICMNGPGTRDRESLIRLIERFDEKTCQKWLRELEQADDGLGVGWGT
jgi:hypothetical protein